jgi:predicted transcriptional regulator
VSEKNSTPKLSRRERQILEILYRLEKATAGEVLAEMPDQPAYSTVRAQLRVLEEKGHVVHEEVGLRYVYTPVIPREKARTGALRHLIDTFFEGSSEKVVAALLGGAGKPKKEELDRIADLIEKARKDEAKSSKGGQ